MLNNETRRKVITTYVFFYSDVVNILCVLKFPSQIRRSHKRAESQTPSARHESQIYVIFVRRMLWQNVK